MSVAQLELLDGACNPVPRIHTNSGVAYRQEAKVLGERARLILNWFRECGPASDRQCKDALFGQVADMNRVRPRVTELVETGLLEEAGNVVDEVTFKRVRLLKARTT